MRDDVVLHLPIFTSQQICSFPAPHPAENWNFGIFSQKTSFFLLESSTYKIPIVQCNIGICVKFCPKPEFFFGINW